MNMTFKIIEKLGGQRSVLDALNAISGMKMLKGELVRDTIGYRAIRNWHSDGKIPPARQVLLIRIAEERGVDWSFDDLELSEELEDQKVPA